MTMKSKSGQDRSGQSTSGQGKTGIKQRAASAGSHAAERIKAGGEAARAAGGRAVERAAAYPVAALVGGLALGAALGALLPRTRQEEELLGSLGSSLNEKALEAATAAREAGQAKLDELGISTNAAGKQVGKLIESIAQVAETAGSAAVGAVRH